MKPEALLEAAAKAARKAYAPYSNYKVGEALLCADGEEFAGCNVENASYGLTNCAERTAIFSAVAAGRKDLVALAVVTEGDSMPYPCGARHQVLSVGITARAHPSCYRGRAVVLRPTHRHSVRP